MGSQRTAGRKRARVLWIGLLGVAILLGAVAGVHLGSIDPQGASWQAPEPASVLPHTDGGPLPERPRAIGAAEAAGMFAEGLLACQNSCRTPYGSILGVADGAIAYSNCTSRCIRPGSSFLNMETGEISAHIKAPADPDLHYVGINFQCVRYARLWWMLNLGLAFGDVDDAHHILYLSEATDVRTGAAVPLARSINGSARRPPQRGDLLVYLADRDDPEWRFGHVAVVVDVDLERGLLSLAEENYDNDHWQDPQAFARQIPLFTVNGRYTLIDVPDDSRGNPRGGRIAGWVHPLATVPTAKEHSNPIHPGQH